MSRYLYIVLGGYLRILGRCTQCMLPTMYLFIADIANPDFVCGCRTGICLVIVRFYEEQRLAKNGKLGPITEYGRFVHNLHSSL